MDRIVLHNFSCFKDLDVTLKPEINLFIGDNASGKTSILRACKYVLSAFFSGFSDENTKWISFIDDDFHEEVSDGLILPERPIELEFSMNDTLRDTTSYSLLTKGLLQLKKMKKKRCRMLREGLDGYVSFGRRLQSGLFTEEGKK